MRAKKFKNFISILATSNYCNWLDAQSPLNTQKKLSSNGDEIGNTNFCDDRRKNVTTWQIVNLEMKSYVKPVKTVSIAPNLQIAMYLL